MLDIFQNGRIFIQPGKISFHKFRVIITVFDFAFRGERTGFLKLGRPHSPVRKCGIRQTGKGQGRIAGGVTESGNFIQSAVPTSLVVVAYRMILFKKVVFPYSLRVRF